MTWRTITTIRLCLIAALAAISAANGKSRYDEIERLYFDAAMFNKFAPGNAFAHEQTQGRKP